MIVLELVLHYKADLAIAIQSGVRLIVCLEGLGGTGRHEDVLLKLGEIIKEEALHSNANEES